MLETMMIPGGHRVDYFSRPEVAVADRLAFYVRGGLDDSAAYSMRARMHLLAGFQVIMSNLGLHQLVAVYLDIADCDQPIRPAYERMKADIQAGLFRQLFVFRSADLAPCPAALEDLVELQAKVPQLEILAYDATDGTVARMELKPADLAGRLDHPLQC